MKRSSPFDFRLPGLLPLRKVRAVTTGLVLSGALAACSSGPPLFLSDGRPTTQVQCTGSFASCEQQARANCDGAFDVVRRSTDNGTLALLYACQKK